MRRDSELVEVLSGALLEDDWEIFEFFEKLVAFHLEVIETYCKLLDHLRNL